MVPCTLSGMLTLMMEGGACNAAILMSDEDDGMQNMACHCAAKLNAICPKPPTEDDELEAITI